MKKALLGRLSDIKYRLSELTKKIDFGDVRITILLFLVFNLSLSVFGQDTCYYKFQVKGSQAKSDTSLYYGKPFEFSLARVYYSKNLFSENNLFSIGRSDTFKIKSGTWYIKKSGKWAYFFSKKGVLEKRKAIVNIAETDYYLVPQKTKKIARRILYEFVARPVDKNLTTSAILRYIFDPLVGIVEILSSDVTLERQKVNQRPI